MESKKHIYIGDPLLRLVDQKASLELAYPDSKVYIKKGVLTWIGVVKTTPCSKKYTLKVEYRMGKYPKTWLMNERLDPSTYKDIPHKYNANLQKGMIELCLFKPKNYEWLKHYSIADTIIPWAIEWLFHYEIWLITRKWHGGGAHPNPESSKYDRYRERSGNNILLNF